MDLLCPKPSLFARIKDFWRSITLVEVMIVVVIIGLVAAMAIPAIDSVYHRDQRDHERYTLWCKVYGRSDLTFDEFVAADKAGMIPHKGQ